jgi:hypothetical protein
MSVTPEYVRANVLTGQARRFYQPYNPATPPVLPARSLVVGGAWSSPWVATGASVDGLAFNFERNLNEIMIEEQSVPVAQLTKDAKFSFDIELSEDTFKTMALAYGGGTITTTAPATGAVGFETLVISDEVVQYSFAFEAENEKGYPRRVLVPIVVPRAQVKTQYNRATKQRTYNVTLESLVPLGQCVFENVTLPGL